MLDSRMWSFGATVGYAAYDGRRKAYVCRLVDRTTGVTLATGRTATSEQAYEWLESEAAKQQENSHAR